MPNLTFLTERGEVRSKFRFSRFYHRYQLHNLFHGIKGPLQVGASDPRSRWRGRCTRRGGFLSEIRQNSSKSNKIQSLHMLLFILQIRITTQSKNFIIHYLFRRGCSMDLLKNGRFLFSQPQFLKRSNWKILICSFLFFSCNNLPTDPRNASNSQVTLSLKSSIGLVGEQSINDSVGKPVEIRVAMIYPEFIKSTKLQIFSSNKTESDTNLVSLSLNQTDTIKIVKMFSVAGERKIIVSSLIENGISKADTAYLTIFDRINFNHKPDLSIDGKRLITVGEICSLKVVVNDTDKEQSHTIIIKKSPQSIIVDNNLYLWVPAHDFVGKDTLIFIATDNGSPALSDTEKVIVEVVENKPDAPQHLRITSHTAGSINLAWEQTARAVDYVLYRSNNRADGFKVIKDSLKTLEFTDQIGSSLWYYYVLARNKAGVSAPSNTTSSLDTGNVIIDITPPSMVFVSLTGTAIKIADTSITVRIICKDDSGIASVTCTKGGKTISVTNTDSVYSAAVLGLVRRTTDTITFIATDNSTSHNKDTLELIVTCDPTMNDKTGPVITLLTPVDSSGVSSPSVTVGIKCTDSSGIASVNCSIEGKSFEVIKSNSDSYTANVTGLVTGLNFILFTVTDASTNSNKTVDTFKIIYDSTMTDNVAPVITLKNPITNGEVIFKDSITMQISCKDDNGIATVTCKRTGQVVAVTSSADSLYSAKITGLIAGKADTITFVATDKSTKGNSSTFTVVVLYTTYTVTYSGNGSTNGSVPVDASTYEKGAAATVKANIGALVKTGSTFAGWNTLENGTGTSYTGGDDFLIGTTNVTLYAKWTTIPVYTVTYRGNGNTGGSIPTDTKSYEQGSTVTVKGNAGKLVKTDSTFGGWNTLANGNGTTYLGGVDFIIGAANVTLFARWIPNTYTITFDGQGATTEPIPATKSITSPVKILGAMPTAPKKTSYTFAGWWSMVNGGGTEFNASTAISVNDTVYAKWEIRDLDGNVYTEVTIGTQVWMVENLRTTKYNDGAPITFNAISKDWESGKTEMYCYYNNTIDADSIKQFGALYNWFAVDTKKLAPKGWHVPSEAEWVTLENYLIANGYSYDETTTSSKIAKSLASTTGWKADTTTGAIGNNLPMNNRSGFSALPCGERSTSGLFNGTGEYGYWWSTTFDASILMCGYSRCLFYSGNSLYKVTYLNAPQFGHSVRALRD